MSDTALDFVGGCLGGMAGVVAGHPFDTVKVRMQMQKQGHLYRGVVDCLIKIVKYESASGLFKGMASPLAGQAFINGIVFGVYGESYRRLHPLPYSVFWAGCCAGFAQTLVCSPMELAKIRMQMQGEGVDYRKLPANERRKLRYTGSFDCLWKIFQAEGLRGIFKGLTSTFARETPAFGAYFASYDKLCEVMSPKYKETGEAGAITVLTAGGIAGVISWVVTYPIDVIKSRVQADISDKYSGNIDCAVKSYRADGWRVFFQGMNSTVVRAFPTNAATFGAVVLFSRLLYRDNTHIRFPWGTAKTHVMLAGGSKEIERIIEGNLRLLSFPKWRQYWGYRNYMSPSDSRRKPPLRRELTTQNKFKVLGNFLRL